MTDLPNHHCPGCGAAQKVFLRYPWYFCRDCTRSATDREGRPLRFQNVSASGGFAYSDDDGATWHECRSVCCMIAGRPALVGEARYGGIVAQPVPQIYIALREEGTVDLTRRRSPAPRPQSE